MISKGLSMALHAVLVAAVVALMTYGLVAAHRGHVRCTNNGGHWQSVNCHEVEDQNCITTDYGQGIVITSCMPITSMVCDTVCRGARAEVGGDR
jgi:hypothetical protein